MSTVEPPSHLRQLSTNTFVRKGEGTVAQLANTNEARHVFVEHLEAAHKLLKLAGLAEAVGAVQDLEKGFEVNCFWEDQSGRAGGVR